MRRLLSAAACLIVAGQADAQLYTNNFETASNWTINQGPATTDSAVNTQFDYSTIGIPAAPSGSGTFGMKMQANQSSGVFGGVSASPTGENFTGNYKVTFDSWANVNGPFPAGGSGSTQMATFGVGTSGTVPQWPGGTQDSAWFAATGDGNSSSDWRAYSPVAPTRYGDTAPGVYAAGAVAGSTNQTNAYYSSFGSMAAPAAQLALFPQQTGTTLAGSYGMEWHVVEITKFDDKVNWVVDGVLIATIDASGFSFGGNNIFFGHSDINATSSSDPNDGDLLFSLVDNVVVTTAVVPEPSFGLLLLGTAVAVRLRRKPA